LSSKTMVSGMSSPCGVAGSGAGMSSSTFWPARVLAAGSATGFPSTESAPVSINCFRRERDISGQDDASTRSRRSPAWLSLTVSVRRSSSAEEFVMTDVVPETPPPANRGLWMLVIGLGIAILIVIAAMIGLVIRRATTSPPEATQASAPALPAPAVAAPVPARPGEAIELNIDLGPGETVADARLENGTLLVRITSPGLDQLLLIDPATSRVMQRIRFNRAPEKR
jgi:hypothetical protein